MVRQCFAPISANPLTEGRVELMTLKRGAQYAVNYIRRISTAARSIVRRSAGRKQRYARVTSVKYAGKADVYNMEVENHHNLSVSGGLIVHNCLDALRYFVKTLIPNWRFVEHGKKTKK